MGKGNNSQNNYKEVEEAEARQEEAGRQVIAENPTIPQMRGLPTLTA